MSRQPLTLASLRSAYARGQTVADVVRRALDLLDGAGAPAVLIGEPTASLALADAVRLADQDPSALPLYGVPFVVKDNIDVGGVPTTAGCPSAATVPDRDATVVARLRAAGAIVVGKGNLDQFATGLVGTRSPYGTPRNTIDAALVPGGSSSGSAVAVACGAVAFALGTDTAGSGRVPAALNRIVGVKPTRGALSTAGVVPAVRRMDCVSVFAATVTDGALVAAIASGHDPADPYSRVRPVGAPSRPVRVVGIPEGWERVDVLSEAAAAAFRADLAALAAAGVELRSVDPAPLFDAGRLLYGGPLLAERFVAVGHLLDGRADLDPTVASIIARGEHATAADAYRAEYRLAALRAGMDDVWSAVDAIATPAIPFAPTLAQVAADPSGVNEALGRFSTFVNLLDMAALVLPSAADGPFALQLIGPAWSDESLATFAADLAGEQGPPMPSTGFPVVVVGAHLRGQPLNHQLLEAGARFVHATTTAPAYRLHALTGTVPPKPGLERVGQGGAAIEVEVWDLPLYRAGEFVARVPPPLCIGSVELADGSWHHGFLCEPHALRAAEDITAFGGWRAYLNAARS